jgi:hypothetical protein
VMASGASRTGGARRPAPAAPGWSVDLSKATCPRPGRADDLGPPAAPASTVPRRSGRRRGRLYTRGVGLPNRRSSLGLQDDCGRFTLHLSVPAARHQRATPARRGSQP